MTKFIMRMLALTALSMAVFVSAEEPLELISVEGRVVASLDPINFDAIEVDINGEAASVSADGTYEAKLDRQRYYQVQIRGDDIFHTVQTFGLTELYETRCDCLRIAEIDILARKEGRAELFFAGDAMAGRRYSNPVWGERQLVDPSDPYPDLLKLLAPIKPYVATADLASVNLEAVLSDADLEITPPKSVVFYSPPELAHALANTGFDYVSLGNNHSYDYLEAGLTTTIQAVEGAQLRWSGAGYNETEALQSARFASASYPFAMLGYVGWSGRVEPNQVAEAHKGGAAYGTIENIRTSVARERAAGFVPIVQLHGSREYSNRPTTLSEQRMRAAIDTGALIVASHHPHVTQGLERYGDGLIAYSLGNFLFDQYFMLTHASYALKAWVEDERLIRAEVIPLRILDYRPVPAVGSVRDFVLERTKRLSSERGTYLRANGGHLVLDFHDVPPAFSSELDRSDPDRQLIYWGDFENTQYGQAHDRTLQASGARAEYQFDSVNGTSLTLTPETDANSFWIQPSTFFRSLKKGSATLRFQIRHSHSLRIGASVQLRPQGMARFEALEAAPFEEKWMQDVEPDEDWKQISFCLPEHEEVRPYRFRLWFDLLGDVTPGSDTISIDNLSLTEGCSITPEAS